MFSIHYGSFNGHEEPDGLAWQHKKYMEEDAEIAKHFHSLISLCFLDNIKITVYT